MSLSNQKLSSQQRRTMTVHPSQCSNRQQSTLICQKGKKMPLINLRRRNLPSGARACASLMLSAAVQRSENDHPLDLTPLQSVNHHILRRWRAHHRIVSSHSSHRCKNRRRRSNRRNHAQIVMHEHLLRHQTTSKSSKVRRSAPWIKTSWI